jgi:putative IMPACT (imprinted ancient) family translation regulator
MRRGALAGDARAQARNWLLLSSENGYQIRMIILENIITDRGSKYAVSGGACHSADEAKVFLKELKRNKKFAKATHNTWACLTDTGVLKNDDGESGAGMVIVRMLERENLRNQIVVVTRWYGGKHLGGDRFRHVQDAVRMYMQELGEA